MILLAMLLALQDATPPVPGACTEPAADHPGESGCFLSGTLTISAPPARLYWHIAPAGSEAAARAMARRLRWTFVTRAHGRWWLHVLSERAGEPALPSGHHVAGPIRVPAGAPVTARFMESLFPPGMRTRVHSHSGPELFYVIDGEQCTATPAEERRIGPGESYMVGAGAHLQAAPKGRRSMVLILATAGQPWMQLAQPWSAETACRD